MTIDTVVKDFFVAGQSQLSNNIFSIISFSVYILLIVGGIYLFYKKDKLNLTKYLIGGLILWGIVEVLKILAMRERPDLSGNDSFPSRHASLSFFVAGFLPVDMKLKFQLCIWAGLIGVSRLALNLHWLTDVVAGSVIGFAFGYLVEKIKIEEIKNKILQAVRR
ncbi:MAG: phosphatase PAP2 family protein [DPANN group archaeon]|nr:phosphatase PAP2 family protein [DPANN group archaeon]